MSEKIKITVLQDDERAKVELVEWEEDGHEYVQVRATVQSDRMPIIVIDKLKA